MVQRALRCVRAKPELFAPNKQAPQPCHGGILWPCKIPVSERLCTYWNGLLEKIAELDPFKVPLVQVLCDRR